MLWQPHIIADIEFLTTEEGGRRTTFTAEQYGCPFGFKGEYFECRVDLSSVGPLPPGGHARVPIRFFHPELVLSRLVPGSSFTLWEGKTIGRGKVVDVVRSDEAIWPAQADDRSPFAPVRRPPPQQQTGGQMGPKTEELLAILDELAALFRRTGNGHWASWLETSAMSIRSGDLAGVLNLMSAYGGMGSLSDVVLDFGYGEAANQRLSDLRSRAWNLAEYLRRNAVVEA
jgi:hypothetical protein